MLKGLPVYYVAPWFLEACAKADADDVSEIDGPVCIIGAGAAGIYAAAYLMNRGVDVIILEAASFTGGRIRSQDSFADFPVELGAEEIHGRRSLLYDLALAFAQADILPEPGENYYWINNVLRDDYYFKHSEVLQGGGQTLLQIAESLAAYEGPDISLQEYLQNFPIDPALFEIANAIIANEYGTQLDRISMFALREAEQRYASGIDGYFLKNRSMWSLFESAFPEAIAKVKLNEPVSDILIKDEELIVKTIYDAEYSAKKVLITVPISILQQSFITFNPPLPQAKQDAIAAIKMDVGSKFILRFSAPFWDEATGAILGGLRIPEYWVSSAGKNSATSTLTAFVMGDKAAYFQGMTDSQIQAELLDELGSMYPTQNPSELCTGILVQQWADEPFIRGAYSYPSPGSTGMREILSEPVGNSLYFAGEACNVNGHIATVHGAMESAYLACKSMMK